MGLLGKIIGAALGKAFEAFSKMGKPDYIAFKAIFHKSEDFGGVAFVKLPKTKTATLVLFGKQPDIDPKEFSLEISNGIVNAIFDTYISSITKKGRRITNKSLPPKPTTKEAERIGYIVGLNMDDKYVKKDIWDIVNRDRRSADIVKKGFLSFFGEVTEGYPIGKCKPGELKEVYPFWIEVEHKGKSEIHFLYQGKDSLGPARFWERIIKVELTEDIVDAWKKLDPSDKKAVKNFRKIVDGYLKQCLEEGKFEELGSASGP
mgnify:CR=1 FL=1